MQGVVPQAQYVPGGRPPVPLPEARPMAKTAIVSGAPPALLPGEQPPDVHGGGPDRTNRDGIRPAATDEKRLGVLFLVPPGGRTPHVRGGGPAPTDGEPLDLPGGDLP
jgi:hypothetical protein